jgi:hypothetical protein
MWRQELLRVLLNHRLRRMHELLMRHEHRCRGLLKHRRRGSHKLLRRLLKHRRRGQLDSDASGSASENNMNFFPQHIIFHGTKAIHSFWRL